MFRDPLSMTPASATAMVAPAFAPPRTPIHRARCTTQPDAPQDPIARLAAAIRAATVDRA